jgi:hypothetical protein
VGQAQADPRDGDTWVVDIDLEKFFDRVNHDGLLSRVRQRVQDRRGVRVLHRCLNAGGLTLEGRVEPTAEGMPPGGPLSPLLANRLLDELDPALETRGPRCVRAADDANISVRRRPAGERVMASVRRVLKRTLRLQGNEAQSAVDRPWNRPCLGFTFTQRQGNRRTGREKALKACQAQGRALTGRTRGRTIRQSVAALRQRMLGWRAFFGVAEGRSPRRDLDTGIRRRLRRDPWTPWGRRGYRELRPRGVGRQVAWTTVKAAHGPWRLRQSPARAIALPQRSFAARGRPRLFAGGLRH